MTEKEKKNKRTFPIEKIGNPIEWAISLEGRVNIFPKKEKIFWRDKNFHRIVLTIKSQDG